MKIVELPDARRINIEGVDYKSQGTLVIFTLTDKTIKTYVCTSEAAAMDMVTQIDTFVADGTSFFVLLTDIAISIASYALDPVDQSVNVDTIFTGAGFALSQAGFLKTSSGVVPAGGAPVTFIDSTHFSINLFGAGFPPNTYSFDYQYSGGIVLNAISITFI